MQAAEHAGGYIRGMVDSPELVAGPLVCASAGEVAGDEVRAQAPLVVFDGCHRGAARVLRGAADPIAARLILTERPP